MIFLGAYFFQSGSECHCCDKMLARTVYVHHIYMYTICTPCTPYIYVHHMYTICTPYVYVHHMYTIYIYICVCTPYVTVYLVISLPKARGVYTIHIIWFWPTLLWRYIPNDLYRGVSSDRTLNPKCIWLWPTLLSRYIWNNLYRGVSSDRFLLLVLSLWCLNLLVHLLPTIVCLLMLGLRASCMQNVTQNKKVS